MAFISGKQLQVEGKVHEGLCLLLLNLSWTLLIVLQPNWCACWSSKSHAHCILLLAWSAPLQILSCLCLLNRGTPRCLIWINTTHPWHSLPYFLPFLPHHVWCSIILCLYLDILFAVCSPLGFYFPLTKSNVRQEKKHLTKVGKERQQKQKNIEVKAKRIGDPLIYALGNLVKIQKRTLYCVCQKTWYRLE